MIRERNDYPAYIHRPMHMHTHTHDDSLIYGSNSSRSWTDYFAHMSSPILADADYRPTALLTPYKMALEESSMGGYSKSSRQQTPIIQASPPKLGRSPRKSVPYPHQVGGSGQLRQLPTGKLMKPLYEKELRFYKYVNSPLLPESLRWLRQVTPRFYGERASGSFSDSEDNATNLSTDGIIVDNLNGSTSPPMEWREVNQVGARTYMSPWAVTMGKRPKKKKSSIRPGASIVLEDINVPFKYPCVLDCKVGFRHYDDDASAEKRRRHIEKSASTTSAKYAVRLTGMQSYKRKRGGNNGYFEFRDKYYGRRVRGEELVEEMKWFFHDGYSVRKDCVEIIVQKLRRIREHMKNQRLFKFYSSSILLVYEGAKDKKVNADVRMIDFAHTQWSEEKVEIDEGYLFGIDTMLGLLHCILNDSSTTTSSSSTSIHVDINDDDVNKFGGL